MEGHGVMMFPNGDVYQGEWLNGKRSGNGVYKCVLPGHFSIAVSWR
jgi:hypothetical protein